MVFFGGIGSKFPREPRRSLYQLHMEVIGGAEVQRPVSTRRGKRKRHVELK